MAISKSTPYVRYKKDFTSSLHLGTIHIESEYLDRTQKTTIESIHGMTWHNKVVNENKELNLLSDTQLELTELEKQYWNTGEKRVSVDEIHTLEEVEPNEDGTYTYMVNSMEGEYIEIYDGINNITSTSDGLDGQFEIVYDTTEEDINGNIALDSIVPQYEITDSGVGAITGAKSTGLTLVNNVTESSKEEVVAIEQQKGQYFTIENTVQGNIKSAILKGNTLVNLSEDNDYKTIDLTGISSYVPDFQNNVEQYKPNTKYLVITEFESALNSKFGVNVYNETTIFDKSIIIGSGYGNEGHKIYKHIVTTKSDFTGCNTTLRTVVYPNSENPNLKITYRTMIIEYRDGLENIDIPYFEGMQSVKVPVLKTTGKNLMPINSIVPKQWSNDILNHKICDINLKPNTSYTFSNGFDGVSNTIRTRIHDDNNTLLVEVWGNQYKTFTTNTNENYWVLAYDFGNGNIIKDIQIEEGAKPTSYEPFKSNILTVNEDLTLRSNGEVYDELDLLTGRLTQRIDENNEVLAQEVVKTVDLTVQNQDGNIIPRIQTQQGITHVSTSSDGLTPVVAMSCQYDTIIKPNTTYTIKLDRPNVSDTMYLQVDLGGTMMMLDADVNAFTIKTPSTLSHSQLRLSGVGNTVKEIIVLEGSRVNDKIEYFEGMKNVENPILVVSNCPYVFGKGGRL